MDKKMTFALFFGNRGFFPGTLIAGARKELKETLEKQGYQTLIMEENETRLGAVETVEEGRMASEKPSMCLDWNNNYGEDENKCIIFHCEPIPQSLMAGKGQIIEQHMLAVGNGCTWGCNTGRIAASPMTFSSSKTEDGKLLFYIGEGRFTGEPIEEGYFGCGGVVEIEGLQDKLINIGKKGFEHHVSATFNHVAIPVKEAFKTYLDYGLTDNTMGGEI